MGNKRRIGIIGVGPRGGYALEQLIEALASQNSFHDVHISLFEETGNFGNGQVYTLNQVQSNWINITERILELDRREAIHLNALTIDSFPSYHEWVGKDFSTISEEKEDTYPPRAQVGKYLAQRFESLAKLLIEAKFVTLYEERITEITLLDNGKLHLQSNKGDHEDFDEVLLTIGHQSTELSEQLAKWEQYACSNNRVHLFKSPYPASAYLNHDCLQKNSTIGIRGFGLAMIDVARGIAERFGHFTITDESTKACTYHGFSAMKDMLVPFSLNGSPAVPKPLNAKVDAYFKPSEFAISEFEQQIGEESVQKEAKSSRFLTAAFAPVAAEVFLSLPDPINPENTSTEELEKIIMQWLEDDSLEHSTLSPLDQSAQKSMQRFVGMATGQAAVSLDYCIGQVWRHCQPSIYRKLSHNKCSDEVFKEVITLDESTKRYSFGPPVESIQQMLALVDAGVLNIDMVKDPDIELTDKGWKFQLNGKSIVASIMIDSVLDAPKIKAVSSPIVKNLLSDDLIEAVHDELGVETSENAYLLPKHQDKAVPIALLGRLAKGTVIGVDAILECFGPRTREWAAQAANNHMDWLEERLVESSAGTPHQ